MIVGYLLLGVFATCGLSRPSQRGGFAPAPDLSSEMPFIVEGDIAVKKRGLGGSGTAMNAFLTTENSLWPRGVVPYRIAMDFGMPVFLDSQIENITQAIQTIENGVPCIEFM